MTWIVSDVWTLELATMKNCLLETEIGCNEREY